MTKIKNIQYTIYWTILRISRSNKLFRWIIGLFAYLYCIIFRSNEVFIFQGKKYHYFYHMYNMTMGGERAVEISIGQEMLNCYKGKNILELGNVLSHYFKIDHDVVDKSEKAPGIINQDIIEFSPSKKYDLIISISTLEHVGFADGYKEKNEPEKFIKAITVMKKCLKSNGMMLITFPVHYNPNLTARIRNHTIPVNHEYFFQRVSFMNNWQQISRDQALHINGYEEYFANANGLYVGVYFHELNNKVKIPAFLQK